MDLATNSSEWWNRVFEKSWEVNHGREQTYGFMHTLIGNLPEVHLAYLMAHDLTILDWGCAFGEGVDTLSHAFPRSRITGLDFSLVAIEEARKHFPDCEFIHTPNGEIPRDFDVIFTSNCLEHFAAPQDVARGHMARCAKLYIAMVPFEEHRPLIDGHAFRFDQESFPEHLDNFVRLSAQPLDVPNLYWPGQQLLVVYGSPSYVAQQATKAPESTLTRDVLELRIRLMQQECRRITDSLVHMRQKLYDLWTLAKEKDSALTQAYQQLDQTRKELYDLWALTQEKDEAISSLQARLTQVN